jgi:carbonic anhydrase
MNNKTNLIRRRTFLKIGAIGTLGFAATDLLGQKAAQAAELSKEASKLLTPDAALQKLLEGNQRFVQHRPLYPNQSATRLKEVAQAQHPFATILSCADSRVPPEILFDQGIGDVFDVRIAGNIATAAALGSIEYAVELLGSPLLMVLGHERCGAVTAAVQHEALPGDISAFVSAILPAVDRVKGQPGDVVDNAVSANVRYQMEQLMKSPLLTARSQSGQLKIVGGRYDLDTGTVSLIT